MGAVDPSSFTGSDKALVTRVEDYGDRSRRLFYLLPDGTRTAVTIRVEEDSDETRRRIGDALMQGSVRYNPQRSRRQP